MRTLFFSILLAFITQSGIIAQTLVNTFEFPDENQYDSFWGITEKDDTLYLGSDWQGEIFKVSKDGQILGSISTPYDFNHGLAWDNDGFWLSEEYASSGAAIYKVDVAGNTMVELSLPPIVGGDPNGISALAMEGNSIWFSVYYPDFDEFPYSYAYRLDLNTMSYVDTLPLLGGQIYGFTTKGDTIIYATDDNDGDAERIYVYSRAIQDTLYSFDQPDPDGENYPRGLHWDGEYLWFVADRIGPSQFKYKALFQYELDEEEVLEPSITVSNDDFNFGEIAVGEVAELPLTLCNTGNSDLILEALFPGVPGFIIIPEIPPFILPPDSCQDFTILFAPTDIGLYDGFLQIAANDPDPPSIAITGIGNLPNNPVLVYENAPIDFDVFCYNTGVFPFAQIQVFNGGSETLVLSNFSDSENALLLTFPPLVGESIEIPAGGNVTLELAPLNVNEPSTLSGTFSFETNDPTHPLAQVDFVGEAMLCDGIEQLSNSSLRLSPNPASEYLKLDNPEQIDLQSIQLFDLSGRLVQNYEPHAGTLRISGMESGYYVLKIKTEKVSYIQKVEVIK